MKKSLKRSAYCFRDDEISGEDGDGGKGEQEELRNDDDKIQQNVDQSCSLLQDPRSEQIIYFKRRGEEEMIILNLIILSSGCIVLCIENFKKYLFNKVLIKSLITEYNDVRKTEGNTFTSVNINLFKKYNTFRMYLGDIRSNESTVNPDVQQSIPALQKSDEQLTSPPDGETNLNPAISSVDIKAQSETLPPYTNQENCNNMFKPFATPSSQIVSSTSVMEGSEPCYRQAQYQNKVQPQFTNPELRFHAGMVDHDDGELFKQTHDLYRDDLRVGGSGYSQLGFLPPGAPDQMLFQDHQVFARDQLNTNNSR